MRSRWPPSAPSLTPSFARFATARRLALRSNDSGFARPPIGGRPRSPGILASSACPRRQRRHWPPTVRKMGPVAWPPQLASRHTLGPQPARWGFGDQDERPPPLGARARPFNGLRPSAGDAWHNSQLTAMNSWAPALLPRRHRFARCSTSNGAATRAAHPSYALFGPASGAGGRGATSFWPAPRQNPTKIPRVRARATLKPTEK